MSEVRLAVPPGHGQLRLWGKQGAAWYALIEWLAQCHDYRRHGGGSHTAIFFTAWVSAEHVAQVDGEDYADVPRIELGADPHCWPTRLRIGVRMHADDYYLGVLDGGPVAPPPGVVWLAGHGSMYG